MWLLLVHRTSKPTRLDWRNTERCTGVGKDEHSTHVPQKQFQKPSKVSEIPEISAHRFPTSSPVGAGQEREAVNTYCRQNTLQANKSHQSHLRIRPIDVQWCAIWSPATRGLAAKRTCNQIDATFDCELRLSAIRQSTPLHRRLKSDSILMLLPHSTPEVLRHGWHARKNAGTADRSRK